MKHPQTPGNIPLLSTSMKEGLLPHRCMINSRTTRSALSGTYLSRHIELLLDVPLSATGTFRVPPVSPMKREQPPTCGLPDQQGVRACCTLNRTRIPTVSTSDGSYQVTAGTFTMGGYLDDRSLIGYMDQEDGYNTIDAGRRGDDGVSSLPF